VQASHGLSRVLVRFDEASLVSCAGLLPAAALTERIDLAGVIDQRLRLAREGANSGIKALPVIGSILVGGDSIDDTDLLRTGGNSRLFDRVRAPSTVGCWLRTFKWSNIRELHAVSRELLARLCGAGAGQADPAGPLSVDLDLTIMQVYGRGKQSADFGYPKVRSYHPQLATLAETGQVIFCRMHSGSAGAARKAKSFLTETVSRLRHAGATGQMRVRADSAFYSRAVITTACKLGVRFSITIRQDKKVRAAIESIPEEAWRPIPYWLSIMA
jgi:Transposase DDE domain group 1